MRARYCGGAVLAVVLFVGCYESHRLSERAPADCSVLTGSVCGPDDPTASPPFDLVLCRSEDGSPGVTAYGIDGSEFPRELSCRIESGRGLTPWLCYDAAGEVAPHPPGVECDGMLVDDLSTIVLLDGPVSMARIPSGCHSARSTYSEVFEPVRYQIIGSGVVSCDDGLIPVEVGFPSAVTVGDCRYTVDRERGSITLRTGTTALGSGPNIGTSRRVLCVGPSPEPGRYRVRSAQDPRLDVMVEFR